MTVLRAIAGLISDTVAMTVRMDPSTHALYTLDYAHHEVHEGDAFRMLINKDVASGGTYNIAFTTPNTLKWIHFTFAIEHELEAQFLLYEGVSSWTGGTAMTPVNANRNSASASGIIDMTKDVTITLGTPLILINEVEGSGKKFGGASEHNAEWILKQNTTYFLLLNNRGTGASESNFQLDWYEHTARD